MASAFTRDEVAGLVAQSRREGLLDEGEHERLSSAFGFETATIGDIAMPMDHVHSLPRDASVEDAERLAAHTGVTRFPVRSGDALVGYLHLKDTLDTPPDRRAERLPARYVRPLSQLAADLALHDALELMRHGKAQSCT